MASKPLTWQKLRALLAASGALDAGWRVGHKVGGPYIATLYHDCVPGKRRTTKLLKALSEHQINHRKGLDLDTYVIPTQTLKV